ncbi:DUF3047 domain-containing protein [Hydrogenophaga sp.]|uniref:DUF3047 domain-containing protein n=1 Tax=Hydrogenophaga sp. TaxID=1904254 RepID=UPI003F6D9033
MTRLRVLVLLGLCGLVACALPVGFPVVPAPPDGVADRRSESFDEGERSRAGPSAKPLISQAGRQLARQLFKTPETVHDWQPFVLPGKAFAPFDAAAIQGRPALGVSAERSVSILRQQMDTAPVQAGRMAFSWKIDGLAPGADLADAQNEDSPVRIVLAFNGDRTQLSPRTHRLSELTRLLTGEPLPYASLVYVWSNTEPVGTVVVNPRTDRIRKLVVESGADQLGRWRDHDRDVHADFLRAFGEPPGPLVAVALMTDTDNTQSRLKAWYGALTLLPRVDESAR